VSDELLRDLVSRLATDPAFAEQVRSDPQGTAASYGLTREQVDQLNGLVAAEPGAGPSMLDARLSKSSLFFGGGFDLDAHSLAGGVSAVPGPSDHGLIIDTGFTDNAQQAGIQDDTIHSAAIPFTDPAQQAGIQDDTIHSAGITSKGMVSLLPTADDAVAHADPLGVLCDGFLEPATFVGDSAHDAGITDTSLAGSDKSFEDLGLREGITDTSLAGSDKGFADVGLNEGPEVPNLTLDQAEKGVTDAGGGKLEVEIKPVK
jgi:hypothetical protein